MKIKDTSGQVIPSPSKNNVINIEDFRQKESVQLEQQLPYYFKWNYNDDRNHMKGSVDMKQEEFVTQQELENLSQRVNHGQELINKDLNYLKDQITDLKTDSQKQQEELLNKIDERFQSLKELHESQLETQSEKTKNYVTSTTFKALGFGIAVMTLIITVLEKFIL